MYSLEVQKLISFIEMGARRFFYALPFMWNIPAVQSSMNCTGSLFKVSPGPAIRVLESKSNGRAGCYVIVSMWIAKGTKII